MTPPSPGASHTKDHSNNKIHVWHNSTILFKYNTAIYPSGFVLSFCLFVWLFWVLLGILVFCFFLQKTAFLATHTGDKKEV